MLSPGFENRSVEEFKNYIEYSAYDLYRTMAEQTDDDHARDVFLTIAQVEKSHMQMLANAVGQCSQTSAA
jgi:rubrerythrin